MAPGMRLADRAGAVSDLDSAPAPQRSSEWSQDWGSGATVSRSPGEAENEYHIVDILHMVGFVFKLLAS